MSQPSKFSGGDAVNKAREAARKNPDKARGLIGKAAGFINKRTGRKYESTIAKGTDAVEKQLGLDSAGKPEVKNPGSPESPAKGDGPPPQ